MALGGDLGVAIAATAPELSFTVLGCEPLPHAAAPTLRFSLGVDAGPAAVRSVMLEVQVRIAATQRGYSEPEQAQLGDLFGAPERWGSTLRGLLWTNATVLVGPFQEATVVDLLVHCTYDFEVAAAKYLAGVRDGEVPLEFLFSGTVFYGGTGGALQIARISWDADASYRLPVSVWRDTMDRYFPGAAWMRLDRATFERLVAYRARHALPGWGSVFEALLDAQQEREP